MLLKINKNRTTSTSGTWGTKNENNYEILNFEFPEELEEYNKRIVYYLGNQKVWDAIIDNKAILTNAITTKGSVKAYVWCTKSDEAFETDVDFRTQIFVMNFFENENADGIVPTPEQVDGFNTMLTAMNEKITEIDALETTIEGAEADRVLAEQGRVDAENTRVSNENTRQSNEATRQTNEQTRQSQEADRERRTNEAISSIQDKTAEYNANAEAKTNAFNANATNKTNAFNTNAENKTSAFNDNSTQKTTAFDNNASSKTTTFNENATSKTGDFNDNATAKTTAFNDNAQAKTDAFDEHTAEITADIEELQQEVEELSENMPWAETEQATEISVDDAAKYSRNKLELFGNTEQTSYDGKNILKSEYFYPNTTNGYNSIWKLVEEGNNYLTFKSSPGNQSSYNIIFPCKPNTNYVYKCEKIILYDANDEIISESGGWNSLYTKAFSSYTLQDTTGTTMGYTKYVSSRSDALSGTNVSGKYVKFTTAEDETECCIYFHGSKANKIKIINPMLYEGTDTDIEYEPYVGGQSSPSPSPDYPQDIHVVTGNNTISVGNTDYPINLGSIELCKIGDYQDYLYKENGNWYKSQMIQKIILNGSETYNLQTVKDVTQVFRLVGVLQNQNPSNGLCNLLIKDLPGDVEKFALTNSNIYVALNKARVTTIEEFKAWLATHNLIIYYDLATPTTTQITDETLIAQLDAIYEHLQLVKGTNNITITPSDLAPYMELSYMQDIKSKLDNLDSRLALLE